MATPSRYRCEMCNYYQETYKEKDKCPKCNSDIGIDEIFYCEECGYESEFHSEIENCPGCDMNETSR